MAAKPKGVEPGTNKPSDWRIAAQGRKCAHCASPFLAGSVFYSLLDVDKDSEWGFVRKDSCDACWATVMHGFTATQGSAKTQGLAKTQGSAKTQGLASNPEAAPAPIFWKTRRPDGADDRNLVDLASMQALFVGLLDDERPEIEALRYVVGLMLARKKMIKVIRGGGGARGDLLFKDPREGKEDERYRLPIPELSEESLEVLKEQLGGILG